LKSLSKTTFEALCVRGSSKKAFLILVWSVSVLYALGFYDRGWVPHDEGTIAQSAERVLAGELPHRDFDEIYTGGLTYLHALAFKVLGLNLISLRILLLCFFIGFVPALYAIAVRLAPPIVAAAVTFLGVAWSVPNYFASVPSWYNLFFATFGILALIRHAETQHVGWLFIAGLFGGCSLLAKITGVYYIAAAVFFLTFREQILSNTGAGDRRTAFGWFFLVKLIGVLLFLAGLMMLLQWRLNLMGIFHFLIPQIAICGILLWSEWREGKNPFGLRVKMLSRLLLPFTTGAVIPVALFIAVYLSTDSLADLYRGVFVLPSRRLEIAAADFPPFLTVLASLPYAALVFFPGFEAPTKSDRLVGFFLICSLVGILCFSSDLILYSIVWQSVRSLGVIAVLAGTQIFFARSLSGGFLEPDKRQKLFLLISMTALLSLIQFPFAAPLYFLYIAPLVCLALLVVLTVQPVIPKFSHFIILLFYLLFAILWTNTGYVAAGVGNTGYPAKSLLNLPRGQLRVTEYDNQLYTQVVNLIQKHSKSIYIYATPDCPEIYFLSGMRNPTRTMFDFLSDGEKDPRLLSALLEKKQINVVVINQVLQFSPPLDPAVFAMLQEHFPRFLNFGRFTVRWKE